MCVGYKERELVYHPKFVRAFPLSAITKDFEVAFRPHSHHIFTAIARAGPEYAIWDIDTQKIVVGPWQQQVEAVKIGWPHPAWNSTGTFIAVGDHSLGYTNIWSAIDGSLAAGPFVHDNAGLNSVAYSPSGESIASASYSGTVKIWNIKTGIAQATITFSGPCMSILYSPNETLLVSCFGTFKNNDKSVRTEVVESATVARYSPDGNGIVAYGPYKVVEGQFGCMALSPNGKYVAVAEGGRYRFLVLDLLTGKDVKLMLEQPGVLVSSASFSSDGAFLAYATIGAGVRICNLLKHGYSM
ncbi:YVTN repeat-like/Quino protein amine dehydrogenase [Ramaria rubella]|nr:YVTN repeat-like/Quino protein amine dehydrogenase [Ramaria rubella]